jgi:NADH:ubiquinone oxidoreductase subunit C
VIKPRNRGAAAPEGSAALDDKGLKLSAFVATQLQDIDIEIDVALDEVVLRTSSDNVVVVCRRAKKAADLSFDYLRSISVVDYIEYLEVNYHLFSLSKRHKMVIKVNLPSDKPSVETVTSVWRGANWFEREAHDLFGVVFNGHPDLRPLLLYEGFEGFPGRKAFPSHEYTEW